MEQGWRHTRLDVIGWYKRARGVGCSMSDGYDILASLYFEAAWTYSNQPPGQGRSRRDLPSTCWRERSPQCLLDKPVYQSSERGCTEVVRRLVPRQCAPGVSHQGYIGRYLRE